MKSNYFSRSSINILIVDEQIEDLVLLIQTLKQQQYQTSLVTNVSLACKYIQSATPDLILFSVTNNNFAEFEHLLKYIQPLNIPVIVLGAVEPSVTTTEILSDYIPKPFEIENVIVRIKNLLQLKFAQAKHLKNTKHYSNLEQQIQEHNWQLRAEINRGKYLQEKLLQLSLYDNLTNLPNRHLLLPKLQAELDKVQRDSGYQWAILSFDCDNFKVINYSLGHTIGDALLQAISLRFQSCLPEKSFIARLGSDEFVIVLSEINNLETAIAITQKIQQKLTAPFNILEKEIFLNFSVGIVLGNQEYQQPEQLLRSADLAMYHAKTLGKRQYQVYDKRMHQLAVERLQLEVDLRKALQNQELTLSYQPIISLKTGALAGFESLVRWQHPQLGMISPDKFIPIAEETGLIIPLGAWILQEACRQLRTWHQKYNSALSLTVNINVAVQQFAYGNLIKIIDRILAETNLPAHCLRLEITESAIMENSSMANTILQEFKARKINICIDDFGTGYSSLSYLHQFPVDNLKIDRSFVSPIQHTSESHKIVDAIADLAHHLDMTVTAEGIETEAQLQYVTNLGCEYGQGYYFSSPLSAPEIEAKYLASFPKCYYNQEKHFPSRLQVIA
ncbi:MAG TPA: EAL domain-containing protein [Xenococcaceae cyanobacterium]